MSHTALERSSLFVNVATLGLVTSPLHVSLKVMIWLTYVFCGSALYLSGIDKVIWLPYLVGLVFYLRIIGLAITSNHTHSTPSIVLSILLFIVYVIFNSWFNFSALAQVFVGYKAYIMLWSVALAIGMSPIASDKLLALWKVFLKIALLQLVVCIIQSVFIVPIRGGSNAWDAVVGTFGGNPFSGGNSGGMAIFLVFAFALVLSLYKYRVINQKNALIYIVCCLVPILIAEVKVVVILIPAVVLYLYSGDIFKKAGQAFLVFSLTGVISFGILSAYQSMHYKDGNQKSLSETIDYAFLEVTDYNRFYNEETGELGRIAAIAMWANYIQDEPLEKALLGYGIAMSRSKSSVFTSELANQFSFNIDRSSLTVLLWELGIIGTICIFWIMFLTLKLAMSLRKNKRIPLAHRAFLDTCGAGIVLLLATLPYNKGMVDTPMTQFLLMWCIGNCMYWHATLRLKGAR